MGGSVFHSNDGLNVVVQDDGILLGLVGRKAVLLLFEIFDARRGSWREGRGRFGEFGWVVSCSTIADGLMVTLFDILSLTKIYLGIIATSSILEKVVAQLAWSCTTRKLG